MKISNPHVTKARLTATSLVLGLALSLSTPYPVVAQEDSCAALGDMAGAMMQARQSGTSLSEALSIVRSVAADDPATAALAEAVVLEAWSAPRMSSPENQRRAVEEFRDTWHLVCLQSR